MEEVDSIVLHQLRELGCDFDDDASSLRELQVNQVVNSIQRCLAVIKHAAGDEDEQQFVYNDAMNMGQKYKIATQLAKDCAALGYKGDIGYQTFLYGNDSDLRRLFLFLIEKLPRDADTSMGAVSAGTSDTLLSRIRRLPVSLIWLPYMPDDVEDEDEKSSIWNTKPVNSVFSSKAIVMNKIAASRRRYYDSHVKVPLGDNGSILEWNTSQLAPELHIMQTKSKNIKIEEVKESSEDDPEKLLLEKLRSSASPSRVAELTSESGDSENTNENYEQKLERIIAELQQEYENYIQQISKSKQIEDDVAKLEESLKAEQEKLKDLEASDRSQSQLMEEINGVKNDIKSLNQQWEAVSNNLNDQLRRLVMEKQMKANRSDAITRELNELKKGTATKGRDMKSKDVLLEELHAKMPQQMPPSRSSYTKRIMEIVNNVKKQKEETKKVLLETRQLQKDINILSGKLSRSFTIADEAIFRDAKSNEWNRRCYKLLASMHDHCDQLLEGVSGTGSILREIRQLEESVETERSKKTSSNLTRIQADLNQMRIENQQLIAKFKSASTESSE